MPFGFSATLRLPGGGRPAPADLAAVSTRVAEAAAGVAGWDAPLRVPADPGKGTKALRVEAAYDPDDPARALLDACRALAVLMAASPARPAWSWVVDDDLSLLHGRLGEPLLVQDGRLVDADGVPRRRDAAVRALFAEVVPELAGALGLIPDVPRFVWRGAGPGLTAVDVTLAVRGDERVVRGEVVVEGVDGDALAVRFVAFDAEGFPVALADLRAPVAPGPLAVDVPLALDPLRRVAALDVGVDAVRVERVPAALVGARLRDGQLDAEVAVTNPGAPADRVEVDLSLPEGAVVVADRWGRGAPSGSALVRVQALSPAFVDDALAACHAVALHRAFGRGGARIVRSGPDAS